ncbi:MAG: aldehyde dehydrogenase family protein [Rhodothermales bacterium]
MDQDLRSIQEARDLIAAARAAQGRYATFSQEQVDAVVAAMAAAGIDHARRLAEMACKETGFGRVESKTEKNLFATRVLLERMQGMRTVGIIRKLEHDTIWEIATPMGVVAALIPSTNPTSTAMYKAIIAAKARCAVVMSPHPRAKICTAEALKIVADAAYAAGAPSGLFGCMTEVTLAGTDELLENRGTDLILATGGSAMVRAAYSKGKPAYGVGSGNVPVYVDRSADLKKAARDITYGASFDWGTLCSTERTIVADAPISSRLKQALKEEKAHFLSDDEKTKLRRYILKDGHLNVDQVGQSPAKIASMAGFTVASETRALVAEVTEVGKSEPLSMETLSPILSYYEEDGWQSGCSRCIEVLKFGGIGHTLCLHCTNDRIIEEFALTKPSMRIVVNTVAALGSVGYTTRLFPAMTLGPGTIGGSITSDNISPMHLLNIKRLAFETNPVNPPTPVKQSERIASAGLPPRKSAEAPASGGRAAGETRRKDQSSSGWIDKIEERLRARAGNAPVTRDAKPEVDKGGTAATGRNGAGKGTALPLSDEKIDEIVRRFKK